MRLKKSLLRCLGYQRCLQNLSLPFVWSIQQKNWAADKTMENLQRKAQTFFPGERASTARNTVEKVGLVRYPWCHRLKTFQILAKFDLQSLCVQGDKLYNSKTTRWMGTHVLNWVSISANSIEERISLSSSNSKELVDSWFDALDG